MTFSIVGRSIDGNSWGVAVASKFLAVGRAVPSALSHVGALATQANANVAWREEGLLRLDDGLGAVVALERLLAADPDREHRQIGLVDAAGGSATHTGSRCMDFAGGLAEPDVAIQGNILVGPEVLDAMKFAWDDAPEQSLEHRLLDALAAGDRAGGDRRGRQSAALLVVRDGAGYGGLDDVAVDLRVDDHVDPINELTRLLELNDFYLNTPADVDKIFVSTELAAELNERARGLGQPDFASWVGTENYEMRVADDTSWVDRRVLEIIRSS